MQEASIASEVIVNVRGKVVRSIGWMALIASMLLTLSITTQAERLPIKTYTTADGLARDHINRIVQDSKGFLWFCTTEGLSRFDGYKFANYGTEQGLADRQVNDFLETRSGIYWVATDKGLCRFNPDLLPQVDGGATKGSTSRRFVAYYPSEDAAARSISAIYEDHAGTIWCGTQAGLFRLDQVDGNPVFSFIDIIQPVGADSKLSVGAIAGDRRGSLWVVATSGLYRRRPDGVVERYTAEEGLREGFSRALLEDRDGRLWVGSAFGVCRLVPDPKPHSSVVERAYTSKDGLAGNYVSSLCQSSDGALWVGSSLGLSELSPAESKEGGRFQSYTGANGLSSTAINALCEDRDGNLWIGTDTGGVMRFAAHGFTTYTERDGLGGTRVGSIFENPAGELFVFSDNRFLNRFDRGTFTAIRLNFPKGISYGGWGWYQITFQDGAGEWWMTTGEGLVRYPRLTTFAQITHARPKAIYTRDDGLPANLIFRLFEDSRRDIWISTLGDSKSVLTRWERRTETFHQYTTADGIPHAAPTAFCEDGSGSLWIGLYEGGLLRYREGRFTPFTNSDGVPPGFIRGLYFDHAMRLWIATGAGLARVDHPDEERPRFITYSTADGLSSKEATCVTEDQWGMIYVGTGRGVDKLDPATGHTRHYTMADGLANSFVNVCFRQHDGSLWFGTLQGLSRLVPQPERPASPPPILITALRIAGVPYPMPELGAANVSVPELATNRNHIEIDFSGLSLAAPESLLYQYKLEGASSQWSAPADQRSVSYPNLAPGSYRFLVRSVSTDGALSESPAVASFRILPPIWQRWWVRLLALVLIAIPAAAIARYRYQRVKAERDAEEALRRAREERLTELERVRTRIATDLHDDIGSSLTQIAILGEVAHQKVELGDSAQGIEPLTRIIAVSNELVDTMSDIVWAINPKKDHLSDLVQRMRRFASDIFTSRGMAFRFNAPAADRDMELGANLRREVFLIFKESVNNVVKHSGGTRAEVSLRTDGDWLTLEVTDNGKGFDGMAACDTTAAAPAPRGGNGIPNMRKRAHEMGGQFEIASGNGKGTTATLRVLVAHQQQPENK
ncbi:MAG TPA: two-component regulator propeller domain-containing protein [Blastocatellia bacterium]|nr:two-component regulator propeller domain-containing protein [Blastocatellia bacterium]